MELKEFYSAVLPRQGNLCLLTLPSAHHHWCNTIDELVTLTSQIEKRYPDDSLYFATAGFKARDRHANNADKLRCLRIDIDAGEAKYKKDPDNTYPSQREALAALMAFTKDTGLTPSYIVDSGHGWHVYWALAEDLEAREWQPLADSLKQLCATKGLKQDRRITADAARVLRPIGTVHVKSGKTVTVVASTARRWSKGELRAMLPEVAPEAQRRYLANDPLAALGNIPAFGDASINAEATIPEVPSDANLVRQGCSAIDTAASPGATVGYDYWRGVLGVAKFTHQGEEAAHAWSEHYPGYDAAETEQKYHSWETGPATCRFLSDFHPGCKSCPHWGKITTPVELGRARVVQPKVIVLAPSPASMPPAPSGPHTYPDWVPPITSLKPWEDYVPDGFDVRAVNNRNVMVGMVPQLSEDGKPMKTEDGRPIMLAKQFASVVFWVVNWGRAADSPDNAVMEVNVIFHDGAAPVSYTFEQGCVASVAKVVEAFAFKGIHTKEGKLMHNYILDSIDRVRTIAARVRINDHMGMHYLPDGQLVAVHGQHIIYADGHMERALISPDLATVASRFVLPVAASPDGKWEPDVWPGIEARALRHVRFLQTHYAGSPKLQLAIMLGLCSPLMAFVNNSFAPGLPLPGTGLTVSLYSRQSARGKTTAVLSAITAFGRPNELMGNGSTGGSTDNARLARLSMHGTMPLIVDEVGRAEAKKAADLVDAVANGAARDRATRTGGLKTGTPWALIALITSNVSARQMITVEQQASDAIQQRLLEIDVDDVPDHTPEQRAQFMAEWGPVSTECAGALGAVIHREIVRYGPDMIMTLMAKSIEAADKLLDAKQNGRFAYRALGAMLAVITLLQRTPIGTIFNAKPMVAEFKKAFESGQEFVEANTLPTGPIEQFAAYLAFAQRFTLVTPTMGGSRNVPVLNPDGRPPQDVHVRYCREEGTVFVSQPHLSAWCSGQKINSNDLIRQLGESGILRPMTGENLRGTNKWANYRQLSRGVATSTGGGVKAITMLVDKFEEAMGTTFEAPIEEPVSNVVPIR